MKKLFLPVLALFCASFSQDITVSKDSIKVYNNPVMSSVDEITFTTHTASAIHLDSAYLIVDELDPALAGLSHSEMEWKSGASAPQLFVWDLDSVAPKSYKLIKKDFEPPSSEPLVFSASGQTSQIFFLEIGYCFICEVMPLYPKYIRGTMRLYFSNGQAIDLRLWSQDLRTGVRPKNFSTSQPLNFRRFGDPWKYPTGYVPEGVSTSSRSYRYLANGRRIPAGKAVVQKDRISSMKVFGKK